MKKIAVIGSGALAKIICRGLTNSDLKERYTLTGVYSPTFAHVSALAGQCGCTPCRTAAELLWDKPDYVVEAASAQAVRDYGVSVLNGGADLIVLSTGALADEALWEALSRTAGERQKKVYLASGAIGGLDLMLSMREMGGLEARIDSCKSPASLAGAPGLAGRTIPEDREMCLFSGPARDAIQRFPKNVNVAVSTALATNGVDRTEAAIYSVPGKAVNEHRICLENELVTANITIASRPDPANPRSSVLTAYSVLALLRNLANPISFF